MRWRNYRKMHNSADVSHTFKMEVPELRKFDDLDVELIETLIRVFSTMMKIPENVVLLNRDQWACFIDVANTIPAKQKVFKELDGVFGKSLTMDKAHAIYLNPRLLKRQYPSLVSTIIHELLHIKFPLKSEDQISTLERESYGRYDYTPNYDAEGRVVCEGV